MSALAPGFYVVRYVNSQRTRLTGDRLMVDSRPFDSLEDAERWGMFVKSEHPKDAVFVIEIGGELQPVAKP